MARDGAAASPDVGSCRVKSLLAHLSIFEKEFLGRAGATLLDWGCESGDEVRALARAFPEAVVSALDDSSDTAAGRYDAVLTIDLPARSEFPLAVIARQIEACDGLYIAAVPYNEHPLAPGHRSQFRVESFPLRICEFERLRADVVSGRLIVVYGSERCAVQGTGGEADGYAEALAAAGQERLAERGRWQARLASEREQFAESCRVFDAELQYRLATYRSQRAWQAMLAIRKAYTAVARRKWPRGVGLDHFELSFPEIRSFIPDNIASLLGGAASTPVLSEPETPKTGKYDVVILPIIDFEARYQRPQQMAAQFARAGHRVFWVSASRFLAESSPEPYRLVQLRTNLWEVQPRAAPFELYGGTLSAQAAERLIDSIGAAFRDHALATSAAIVQFPSWRQVALGLRERFGARIVYDCMDDWPSWESEPLPGKFSLAEEERLIHECDVAVVSARELRDKFAGLGVASELVSNAADFDFFSNPPQTSPLTGLTGPVVGFFGAIAEWFDVELILEVARSRPQYSFVLIGPVLDDMRGLEDLPNVRFLGEKPYRELPAYLSQFDACLLPFRINRLTRSVDPVKIYEYLSQGKPVISTPLKELAPIADLIYTGGTPGEFAAGLDRAVAERDEGLRRRRIAFAAENTWAARVDVVSRAIQATLPLVSILLVTRNSKSLIGPCLAAVLQNTSYPSYEIVVVDNDSTDGTLDELVRLASGEARIRVACLDGERSREAAAGVAAGMAKGVRSVWLEPATRVKWGWLETSLREEVAGGS